MLDTATDYSPVKRWGSSSIEVPGTPMNESATDQYRALIYRLTGPGTRTLVFTSDPVAYGPIVLNWRDENDVALWEVGIADGQYYQIEIVAQNLTETYEEIEDEHFVLAIPDDVSTIEPLTTAAGSGSLQNALDTLVLSKGLYMAGHNVLHGEMGNASGYTTSRIIRGYDELTEAEMDILLAAAESPGDADVLFKHLTTKTVSDSGNEKAALGLEVQL